MSEAREFWNGGLCQKVSFQELLAYIKKIAFVTKFVRTVNNRECPFTKRKKTGVLSTTSIQENWRCVFQKRHKNVANKMKTFYDT